MTKQIIETIVQDNAPANIDWRGDVSPAIRGKSAALAAMKMVVDNSGNFFRVQKRGSRWFLQVGQPS